MPEWLRLSLQPDEHVSVSLLILRLSVALVFGCLVAGIYRLTRREPGPDMVSLVPTLVLLTVIIAMVTLAIGDNIARAFSLVGSLAIVRFRTVVEDTRDTAFVILAVAVGLAAGAGFLMVALVGLPFTAVAAFLFRARPSLAQPEAPEHRLTIRIGAGQSPETQFQPLFVQYLQRCSTHATATARQGASLEITYDIQLRREESALELVRALNQIEGVQSVELRSR